MRRLHEASQIACARQALRNASDAGEKIVLLRTALTAKEFGAELSCFLCRPLRVKMFKICEASRLGRAELRIDIFAERDA